MKLPKITIHFCYLNVSKLLEIKEKKGNPQNSSVGF